MTGVDLVEEDRKFMKYLVENGWEGEIGEDDDKKLIITQVDDKRFWSQVLVVQTESGFHLYFYSYNHIRD